MHFQRRHIQIEMRKTVTQHRPNENVFRHTAEMLRAPATGIVDIRHLGQPPQPTPDTGLGAFFQ
jgi:hypothetical protein